MSANVRSVELLNRIADALGIDAAAFEGLRAAGKPATADARSAQHQDCILMHRLLVAFHSLQTAEARFRAVHLVEALVARTSDDGSLQADGTGREGGS